MNATWQAWNDGSGKRKWFLARVVNGVTEYHWSKPDPHGQQHVIEFPSGHTPVQKVIEMTEHFFGGGTDYEKPLQMALDIMEERFDALGKARPDIVFITDDAYGSMDADFMHEWNRVKDKTSLKCYGIAIGCDSSGALAAVSDNVREITALVSDPRNVSDLFRTI